MRKLIWPSLFFLMLAGALSSGIWWWALGTALDRLEEQGKSELSLASDRLLGQLQRFRQLAVVLADHPSFTALLRADSDQFVEAAEQFLLETADKTGSYEIFVLSAAGRMVASSRQTNPLRDFSTTPYFHRAMYGALGTWQAQIDEEPGRAFYFAAPIQVSGGAPFGAIVVKVDIEAVETSWRADPNILFFTDAAGVVFVSNRTELLFTTRRDLSAVRDELAQGRKFNPSIVRAFPVTTEVHRSGHTLWQSGGGALFASSALHLVKLLPIVSLDAEILIDAAPALLTALLQAAFAMAVLLVFGAALLIVTQRRQALADRLELEASAKQELEDRVARRTEQLSGVNLDLREQIKERRDAEEALKKAQQDLVQAGKLSALGQMSAGISHELNQPLMAIRSFAENATQFLERGDTKTVEKNLGRISDLARRMGRIIKNLRAFARKEGEPMANVDLTEVVNAALELVEQSLEQAGVSVDWVPPVVPVIVRGGEVRLQQVVVNLLSNAADAMDGLEEKKITIKISQNGNVTRLSVADIGPGLDEPEKIFEPFYSTKPVGAEDGMGLGLSISYGIVQSFGGQITGRNRQGGGAEFSVDLTPASLENAA